MPHSVLRQFLWELKAGDSAERVAKEKELTALNWLGTQRWELALAAYADVESTDQRWCCVHCTILLLPSMHAQAIPRAGAVLQVRTIAVRESRRC